MINRCYAVDVQRRLKNRGIKVAIDVIYDVLDVRYRNGKPKWEVIYRFREHPPNGPIAIVQLSQNKPLK